MEIIQMVKYYVQPVMEGMLVNLVIFMLIQDII